MSRNSVAICVPRFWETHALAVFALCALSIRLASHVPLSLLLALAIADANILGGWAAADRKLDLRRVVSAYLWVCLLAVAVTVSAALWLDLHALVATFLLLLSSATIVFAIVAIAERRYSTVFTNAASTAEWVEARHRFSLAQLLFAVAVVATMLGAARLTRLWLDGWAEVRVAAMIFAPALSLSHAGVAWAILAGNSLAARVVIASMVIPGVGLAARVLASRALLLDELDYIDWVAFIARALPLVNVVQAIIAAITYILLRRDGWRFASFTPDHTEERIHP